MMKVISRQQPQSVSHKPVKVAMVGECMIEMRAESASDFSQTFGGDTLNTAVYLARLNPAPRIAVEYVTAIGADSFSAMPCASCGVTKASAISTCE